MTAIKTNGDATNATNGSAFFVNFLLATTGTGEETSAVKYAYDLSGNLVSLTTGLASVTATGGKVTTYEYSPFGELLKETDPMNYEKSYTYD